MPKTHVVKLTIENNTGYSMSYISSWFDSGRVADGWNIPENISAGDDAIVEMYERDHSLAGCSGYINYGLNGGTVTVAFSNPSVGKNKVGCGVSGKSVWKDMDAHDYEPFTETFDINNVGFTAYE